MKVQAKTLYSIFNNQTLAAINKATKRNSSDQKKKNVAVIEAPPETHFFPQKRQILVDYVLNCVLILHLDIYVGEMLGANELK